MKTINTLILMLFMFNSIKAQTAKENINADDVVIEGKITDSLLSLVPDKKVNVTLYVSKFPVNGSLTPREKVVLETKYNEPFKFVIKSPADRFFMRIDFRMQNPFKYWSDVDNVYILEKGDRVSCKLSDSFFEFSGKGSEKLQCQSEIYRCRIKGVNTLIMLSNSGQFDKEVALMHHKLDSINQQRLTIVKHFAPKLGKEMTDIMIANCHGLKYYTWFRTQRFFTATPVRIKALINSDTFKKTDLSLMQKIDPAVLITSPNYCDFVLEKINLDNLMASDGTINKPELKSKLMFESIKSNYTGLIREKLLTMFIYNLRMVPYMLDYLDQGLSLVKKQDYREILETLKRTNMKGVPFFPFEMEDDKNNIIKLANFKNEIIILDFWYTGCTNCVKLNKSMAPIVEAYRNNPKVKFISVSIDDDKNQWLKSIKSGLYTHSESINLYAGGKKASSASEHPLIRAYNIKSYPTLFIIKDGKMYSSLPPRDPQKFKALIEEALTAD